VSELCQHGVFPELCKACKVLRLQARVAELEAALLPFATCPRGDVPGEDAWRKAAEVMGVKVAP